MNTTRPITMNVTVRTSGACGKVPVVATRTCLRTGLPGRPFVTASCAARRVSLRRRVSGMAVPGEQGGAERGRQLQQHLPVERAHVGTVAPRSPAEPITDRSTGVTAR